MNATSAELARNGLPTSRSRIESLPQLGRNDGAQIVALPEGTIANARDKVVERVSQRAWNYRHESRYYSPSSPEPPQNMNAGIRAHQQRGIIS